MEKAEHDPGLYFEQSSRKSDVHYYLLLYHANHTVGQKTQCNTVKVCCLLALGFLNSKVPELSNLC